MKRTLLTHRHFFFIIFLAGLLMILKPEAVCAQDQTPSDDEVNQIASQLYCPVCENIPLDECTTQVCQDWRDMIRQRLAEGWSQEEIKSDFVKQYGERVLGEPPKQGLHWLLYVIPPVVILTGSFILWNKLHKTKAKPIVSMDDYLQRVEQDLEALKEK